MLDYNREYDPAQVDTPENRGGFVRLMRMYARNRNGSPVVFTEDEYAVTLYLLILADYHHTGISKPECLESAIADYEKTGSDKCFAAFIDCLRYANLIYISQYSVKNGWPEVFKVISDGKTSDMFSVFTRKKWIPARLLSLMHYHHITAYDIPDVCTTLGVKEFYINPGDTEVVLAADNLKSYLESYNKYDEFWKKVRTSGLGAGDLFSLLARDYLYRNVTCIYGNWEASVTGYVKPYKDGQAPGYNIKDSDGRMVYVPLDSIKYIKETPGKNK